MKYNEKDLNNFLYMIDYIDQEIHCKYLAWIVGTDKNRFDKYVLYYNRATDLQMQHDYGLDPKMEILKYISFIDKGFLPLALRRRILHIRKFLPRK